MPTTQKYYGKFRGKVVNNTDPLNIGRVQVAVPEATGSRTSKWAMPCVLAAAAQMGIYAVPAVGSNVWVEFERGDPAHPIWTGDFWDKAADVPAPGANGGVVLKSASGATIVINDTGITIQNGKGASIVLTGPTVTINNGALAIT
jgi:uncharacterized protein involved in type VI secretion and phage assembly